MIYFDNAATSRFKPLCVLKELIFGTAFSANPGRSGHSDAIKTAMKIEKTRSILTGLFGEGKVVFTKNCTEALNLAILGTKPEKHVVSTIYEHNSVLRTLKRAEAERGLKVTLVKPEANGYISANGIHNAINRDTELVIINHTSNVTGITQRLEEIASPIRKRGIKILVDASQSLGHVGADYSCCDMLCCSGHKSLHGPQGTGFLLLREGIELSPLLYGGTGSDSKSLIQPGGIPEGLEAGTLNSASLAALGVGAEWTYKNFTKINDKLERLTQLLVEGLRAINGIKLYFPNKGIVLFNLEKLPSGEVADILNRDYNIGVRAGLHCAPLAHRFLGTYDTGAVRASLGYNNSVGDVEELVLAVSEIIDNYPNFVTT